MLRIAGAGLGDVIQSLAGGGVAGVGAWGPERQLPTPPGVSSRQAPSSARISSAPRALGPTRCGGPSKPGVCPPRVPKPEDACSGGLGAARRAALLMFRKCCGCLWPAGFVVWTPRGPPERAQGLCHLDSRFWGSQSSRSSPHSPAEEPLGVNHVRAGPYLGSTALFLKPSPEQGPR